MIPTLAFGTYQLLDPNPIICALKHGCTHIDTAQIYRNENVVKHALKETGTIRENIFITTKIGPKNFGYELTTKSFLKHIEKMGLDYVDMCLLHFPEVSGLEDDDDETVLKAFERRKGAWRALEKLVDDGMIRNIGVSNYCVNHLEELFLYARIRPVLNQLEIHPYFSQRPLVEYCQNKGIMVQSYGGLHPLGLLSDPLLRKLSKKYKVDQAKIVHAWMKQCNILIVCQSINDDHIKSNLEETNIKLTNSDMDQIYRLNGNINLYWNAEDVPALTSLRSLKKRKY